MGTRLSSGKKASEVAAELNVSGWNVSGWNVSGWNVSGWNVSGWNVSGWNVSGWRKELEAQNGDVSAPTGELNALELVKENGRLRRENESLARQRDILKKAISIFSADNPLGGSR